MRVAVFVLGNQRQEAIGGGAVGADQLGRNTAWEFTWPVGELGCTSGLSLPSLPSLAEGRGLPVCAKDRLLFVKEDRTFGYKSLD